MKKEDVKNENTFLNIPFESLIIVGVLYFVLTFTLSKLVGAYERRLKQSD